MAQLLKALLLAVGALLVASVEPTRAAEPPITLFAAASTTDAVTEIAEAFAAETGRTLRPVFAASSTLARQIEQGAPADLFLSANVAWMDHLDDQGLLVPKSRTDLLANRLVLIAPADSGLQLSLSMGTDFGHILKDGRLAIGDPAHVPAGIYAREALEALMLWDQVADRLAQASNVRAALALVERGEVPAGIVYETDAAISSRVRIVEAFPSTAAPEITYPLAIVAGRETAGVRSLHAFLRGPVAAEIFRKHGFTAPGGAS